MSPSGTLERIALLSFAITLVAQTASAQAQGTLNDLLHARNYAMAGAYRAHGLGAEAVLGNPAAITLYKRYQLDVTGAWNPTTKLGFIGSSIVDSSTAEVGAGVSYQLVSVPPEADEGTTTAHVSTLGLAMPLGTALHLGVSGRHVVLSGGLQNNGITVDAGLLLKPIELLAISFSGHNLIDVHNPLLPRYYVGGAALLVGPFTAAFDLTARFLDEGTSLSYALGAEYLAFGSVAVRAGFATDPTRDARWLGVGAGFMTEGGGLDFGYRQELGRDSRVLALTLKLAVR